MENENKTIIVTKKSMIVQIIKSAIKEAIKEQDKEKNLIKKNASESLSAKNLKVF